jgi:hypothetical protein
MTRPSRTRLPAQATEMHAAAAILRRRADKLEQTCPPFELAVTIAALNLIAEIQGEALADLRTAIGGILEPAARLFASDHLFAAFVSAGQRFTVPANSPTFIRAQVLLAPLFEKIPPSIRPDNFDHASVFEAARSISQPLIAEIREGE